MATISCDPATIVRAAKCFPCVPKQSRRWVKTYLLCQFANAGGGGSAPTATGVSANTISSVADKAIWDAPPANVTTVEIWTSTDNVTYALAGTVAPPVASFNLTPAATGAILFVKVRWCVAGTCGAFGGPARVPGTVANWAARVLVNGGAAVSTATLASHDAFWLSLFDNGLDVQINACCTFCNDSLIAAITPFIKNAGNDPWTNNGGNFVLGDLSVNGLTGNAINKVLDTGVVPTTAWQNTGNNANANTSGGISIYTFTVGSVSSGVDVGSASNAAAVTIELSAIFTPTASNLTFFDFTNITNGRISVVNAGWKGFLSGNRTSGSASALYEASSVQAFTTLGTDATNQIGNAMPTVSFCCHGFKSSVGVATANSDRTISFAALHFGLTSAQAQNYFNAVQALRVALGGGFI